MLYQIICSLFILVLELNQGLLHAKYVLCCCHTSPDNSDIFVFVERCDFIRNWQFTDKCFTICCKPIYTLPEFIFSSSIFVCLYLTSQLIILSTSPHFSFVIRDIQDMLKHHIYTHLLTPHQIISLGRILQSRIAEGLPYNLASVVQTLQPADGEQTTCMPKQAVSTTESSTGLPIPALDSFSF